MFVVKITGFVAGSALALTFATLSLAATSPQQLIKVSLRGEADSPMAIDVDSTTAKAGLVQFSVSNDAVGTDHEVVLVKLKDAHQKLEADPKTHKIDESTLQSMGEVSGLKPGAAGVLKVKLAPSKYVLLCNHKNHLELGMAKQITVVN